MDYTIISYFCGTWPNYGGVARYETQLKEIFPNRLFFIAKDQKNLMLQFLSKCKNPIIITDNHLACDIPNTYPVILVHHGSALTHAERDPDWDPYWKNLCCIGQKIMLNYRTPANTWIISCSSFCTDEFTKYFGNIYKQFHNNLILHASELNESLYKTNFNKNPIILGNWGTEQKGSKIIPILASSNSNYTFQQLNIIPFKNESSTDFNKRKQTIYINADMFLQLSLSEGNSYASLDALLCGLVVIASDVGLFYKDVPDNCYVRIDWQKNNDINYIKAKLNYAWENRFELAHNARQWYLSNCNFTDWKIKMSNIINEFNTHIYNAK